MTKPARHRLRKAPAIKKEAIICLFLDLKIM
jgi:hypothetical protein